MINYFTKQMKVTDLSIEDRIVVDYTQGILIRLCRRTFGAEPTIEYFPDQKRGFHVVYDHVIRRGVGRAFGHASIHIDFPDVVMTYTATGLAIRSVEYSMADPKSYNLINKFYSDVFKHAKKWAVAEPERDNRNHNGDLSDLYKDKNKESKKSRKRRIRKRKSYVPEWLRNSGVSYRSREEKRKQKKK